MPGRKRREQDGTKDSSGSARLAGHTKHEAYFTWAGFLF
jgi:hypothetical protein